jgi:DNA-binding transcriptional ArsR family regulator
MIEKKVGTEPGNAVASNFVALDEDAPANINRGRAGGVDRSIAARWTERLATRFCPVSSYFLANYHRLAPHEGADGLTSTEAMLVIHLVDHKWSADAPFPTTGTLAKRMGISQRQVRHTLKRLEDLGFVLRERPSMSSANRYRLEPLFAKLEALIDQDVAPALAEVA